MNPQQYGQNYMGPPLSTFPPSYVSHNYGPTSNTFNNCYPSQQQPAYGAVYSPVAPLPAFQYHHPNENPYFSQAGPCHHPSANPHFSQAGPCHHPSANPHFSQAEPCRHPYGNPQFTQAGPCHHPAPSCHYDHRGERYEPQTFPPSHAAQAYFFNDQYRGAESLRQQPFADNHQVQQPPTIRMGFDDSSNPNTRARPHATTDLRPQAQSFIPRSNRVHKTKTKASGRVVELQDERNNDNPRHDDGKQDGLSGQPSLSLPRKPEKVVPWKRRRGNTPTKTSPQAKRHSKVPIPATCVSSQTNEAQQSVTPSVTPQSLQNGSRSKLLTHGSSSARAKNRDSGNLGLEQDLTKSSSTLQTSLTGSESRLLTHGSLPAPVGNRDSGNSGTEQDLSKPSSTSHAPSGGSQSNLLGCSSLSARVRHRDSDNLGREQSLHQTRPKHESLQTRHQAFVSDNDPPSSQAVTCCPAGIYWQETEHITPSPYTNLLLFAERSSQRFSSGLAVTECISIITNQSQATYEDLSTLNPFSNRLSGA